MQPRRILHAPGAISVDVGISSNNHEHGPSGPQLRTLSAGQPWPPMKERIQKLFITLLGLIKNDMVLNKFTFKHLSCRTVFEHRICCCGIYDILTLTEHFHEKNVIGRWIKTLKD